MPDNIPTSNFTDQELKFSYWYVTHKIALRRWLIWSLTALAALLWFYVAWQLVFYALNYNLENSNLQRAVLDNGASADLADRQPQELQISETRSLASEDGSQAEFLAKVINPNRDWLATFDYHFSAPGATTTPLKGFALPGSEKYLMGLGLNSGEGQLGISNLKWERFSDFADVFSRRFNFTVTNQNFLAGAKPGDPNRLVFDLTNNSAYGYWEVGVGALLFNLGDLVSANYVVLDRFKSNETRHVELNWSRQLPRIDNVQILPDVNILDESNVMPPG